MSFNSRTDRNVFIIVILALLSFPLILLYFNNKSIAYASEIEDKYQISSLQTMDGSEISYKNAMKDNKTIVPVRFYDKNNNLHEGLLITSDNTSKLMVNTGLPKFKFVEYKN